MRAIRRIVGGAGASAGLLLAGAAGAQVDINPPLPNVLLLVDTSGSMEFKTDGTKAKCRYKDASLVNEATATPSERSRWADMVEVLTGDVVGYECYAQDRSSAAFRTEYQLSGVNPYDYKYYLPYHRIVSNACTMAPGLLDPANAFQWTPTPFKFHAWDNPNTACANFQQDDTGLLDSFRDSARFGLMTFDTLTPFGTGMNLPGTTPNHATGIDGTWSYFPNWHTGAGTYAKGKPTGCNVPPEPFEVGARNAGAPPWEGRMVPFGPPDSPIAGVYATNQRIQDVLRAVRPYGATPIDGMLSDAQYFYLTDPMADPFAATGDFGPRNDPFVKGGCRTNYIILLSDGAPNLDFRPQCEGTVPGCPNLDGVCPYDKTKGTGGKAWEVAYDLANPLGGKNIIKTFVVGFAVSDVVTQNQAQPVDCSKINSCAQWDPNDPTVCLKAGPVFDPQNLCGPAMDPKLSACCALAKIAYMGGTVNAHFASNKSELRSQLSAILSSISQKTTSRTMPVFAASSSGQGAVSSDPLFQFAASFEFNSSLQVNIGKMWAGKLDRIRWRCMPKNGAYDPQPFSTVAEGDNFAANLNSNQGAERRIFTAVPQPVGNTIYSDRTTRVSSTITDGVSTQICDPALCPLNQLASAFPGALPTAATNITVATCTNPTFATAAACKTNIFKWELGALMPPNEATRFKNAFGDVYHSTPAVLGPPIEYVSDESYATYRINQMFRPMVLYTATNDGQLHAFKVIKSADPKDTFWVNQLENNELWAFLPPAVLPRIASQYPNTHQMLLDGAPAVKDVVPERTKADAQTGIGNWRAMLVAGFGAGGVGYYALDVTDPVYSATKAGSGPKFLWQLTTDDKGVRLFGKRGANPAIATLFFDPAPGGGGNNPREITVALLPGGDSDAPLPGKCARTGPLNLVDTKWNPRPEINCYAADAARSLTIVRLDTGEIIRTFRRQGDGPVSLEPLAKDFMGNFAQIDSPITGTPVVYPSRTGGITDRAYVGDRDGGLWRIDLSSADPKRWDMRLWFDTYSGYGPNEGQPIATVPVLTTDPLGNIVVLASTGDQDAFTPSPNMVNFVFSITEDIAAGFKSKANWRVLMTAGERVSGPLTLFNGALYFASLAPQTNPAEVCQMGSSRLWGVDYRKQDPANAPWPLPKWLAPNNPNPVLNETQPAGFIAFGIGVNQKPTCRDEQVFNDPYLGYGTHVQMSNVSGGGFQVVWQTGKLGQPTGQAQTNTMRRDLTPPPLSARIDSWAAIVE